MEINHEEKIPFISIVVRVPYLTKGHAIDVVVFRMLHHINIGETHIDISGFVENIRKALQVLLLGLAKIHDLVVEQRHLVDIRIRFLHHHFTSDNQCLVAIHAVEQLNILAVVCRAKVLNKVDDNLATRVIQVRTLLRHQLFIAIHFDGNRHTVNQSLLVEVHGQFLACFRFDSLVNIYGNATHLITGCCVQATTFQVHRWTTHRTAFPHLLYVVNRVFCHVIPRKADGFLTAFCCESKCSQ